MTNSKIIVGTIPNKKMNWAEAKQYAESLGMRLPTRMESLELLKLELNLPIAFWTSEEYSPERAYVLANDEILCMVRSEKTNTHSVVPFTLETETVSKRKKSHTVVAVYGENVGLHSSRPEDLVRFLDKERIQCGNDFRNVYQAQQISYETEEEVNAFVDGINSTKTDWNDFAIVTETAFIPDILDMFGQKVPDNTPSNMDRLKGILRNLQSLKNSRWIPFTSPSPSSTEAALKHEVNAAIGHLEKAISLNC